MAYFESGLPLILTFLISLVHFMGEELEEYFSGFHERLVSFGTGVSVSYIFLRLLPEFQNIASAATDLIFLAPLAGFSSIHLAEKYVSKHEKDVEEIKEDFKEIHSVFLFVYYSSIGFLLASLVSREPVSGMLFFVPIIFHSAISSLSLTELHDEASRRLPVKLAVSLAPILGALLHRSEFIGEAAFETVFGTVIGMFVYVVIRDSIPRGDRGLPLEYAAGALFYIAVIFAAGGFI
jgi:hypothetical protein